MSFRVTAELLLELYNQPATLNNFVGFDPLKKTLFTYDEGKRDITKISTRRIQITIIDH